MNTETRLHVMNNLAFEVPLLLSTFVIRVTSDATPVVIDEEESLLFKRNLFRAAADDSSKNHS